MACRIAVTGLVMVVVALGGCRASSAASSGPATASSARWTGGTSVDGRAVEVVRLGDGPDVVLLIASIHGDESAGTRLLEGLIEVLRSEPPWLRGRTVVLVPLANPDGVHDGLRENRRGVDLNRNFPARNRRERSSSGPAALSEPEARVLHDVLVRFRPARIVSLHEPLACLDYDGPGAGLAGAMAAVCPLPVRRLGGRPGSLGSFAGEDLGIPIITMELPGASSRWSAARLWSTYGEALLVAVEGVPSS